MGLKRFTVFAAVFAVFAVMSAGAFANWTGFDDGMSTSAKNGRYAIVDFYADWCVWCKKMDKEVFSKPDVANRLSREFVTIRVDTESPAPVTFKGRKVQPRELAGLMQIQGLPTLVVFNSKGDPVTALPGYVDAKTFMMFLDYVKKEAYKTKSFEDYYRSVR